MDTTITENGDHYLDISGTSNVVNASSSTVKIVGANGGATVIVGEEASGVFDGFVDGEITLEEGVFDHGKGSRPMVRVSGITTPIVVSHRES